MIRITLLALVLVFAVDQTEAILGKSQKPSLIVDSPYLTLDGVAQLCDPRWQSSRRIIKQLRRVSSITWLDRNLENIGAISKGSDGRGQFFTCPVAEYRAALSELARLVEARQPDACSDRHISLVEKFHMRYIQPILINGHDNTLAGRHDTTRTYNNIIPEPIKWYFIHYVWELSELCQQSMLRNLDSMMMGSNNVPPALDISDILAGVHSKLVGMARAKLVPLDAIRTPEDFHLFWNSIDRINGDTVAGFDTSRVIVKVREAAGAWEAQRVCLNLRPLYADTILTAMRLIDLGYSSLTRDRAATRMDIRLRSWYSIAQSCHFLCGFQIKEDPSLPKDVIGISKLPTPGPTPPSTGKLRPVHSRVKFLVGEEDTLWSVRSRADPNILLAHILYNAQARLSNFKSKLRKSTLADMIGEYHFN